MRLSFLARGNMRFFSDLMCPNSWTAWNVLQKWNNDHPGHKLVIDYAPINTFKLDIFRRRDLARERLTTKDETCNDQSKPSFYDDALERERRTTVLVTTTYNISADWKEIHEKLLEDGTNVVQLFLMSIKENFPHLLDTAVNHLGSRVWEKRLPLHKGCHFSKCAREIGLDLRDAEFIVSRLPHRHYRRLVDINCEDAIRFGAVNAPLFVYKKEDGFHVFQNVNDFLESVIDSELINKVYNPYYFPFL